MRATSACKARLGRPLFGRNIAHAVVIPGYWPNLLVVDGMSKSQFVRETVCDGERCWPE